ncbi:MAG: ATP-dependent metallopeptidase FtsH/Yme1/Tma family protein, partial [Acidimicrobiia bacterium]|nr:ATP-dependent metallopeptidase FtsH/Yme1/Tma family protein [Acidimicrobiia bacterium]
MGNLPPPPPPPPPGGSRNRRSKGGRGFTPGGTPGSDGETPRSGLPRWSIWVIVGVMAAAFLLPSLWPRNEGEDLTYTQFMAEVRDGKVDSVEINNTSNRITGVFENGDEFVTTGGGDRGLSAVDEAVLIDNEVNVAFNTPSTNWLLSIASFMLPVLLIIGFFVWMQRRASGQMGNVMSIGRSRAKAYTTDKPSTTFSDIAGYEGVKTEITEVVDFLR